MRLAALAALCLVTGACSSITEGTSQDLTFNSVPAEADCTLQRNGENLGSVRTPGTIKVQKTKHDIDVTCDKPGYQQASTRLKSDIAGMTVGNAIAGGLIGWAIDSATGADNKYNDVTTVTLTPTGTAAAPVAPVAVPPASQAAVPTS